jgi:hypothetical protein
MWRANNLGENPVQVVHEQSDKKLMYSALHACMKSRERGYERWKRRRDFATFLTCYSLRLIPRAAAAAASQVDAVVPTAVSTAEAEMAPVLPIVNPGERKSAVIVVFKSKDLIRFISKFL